MTVINPFDLERIFVVIVAGSPEIFTGMMILFLSALAGYFHMDNKVMMIMYALAGIIMGLYIGQGLYILIILAIGLITFYSITRLFNR